MCTVGPSPGSIGSEHRPLLYCAVNRKYLKCLLLSMLVYICMGFSISCWSENLKFHFSGCTRTHSFIPFSLFLILYVVYIVECWRSAPLVSPLVSREHAQQYIYLLRHAAPVIWWRVVCYHFVRRTRQIIRYRGGAASTKTQIYYERSNSHVDEKDFDYSNCGVRDISKEIINHEKHSLVVINLTKCFSFSDLSCENQYLGQRCDFFRSNETWDSYLEAKEGMKLRNVEWKDQVIVCKDPKHPPLYISHTVYWIFSIFLCSWFYRVFLEHKAAVVDYQVEKIFGGSSSAPSEDFRWDSLVRVATMDSTDMEWQIQTNQLRVPSYGEATMEMVEQPEDNSPTRIVNNNEASEINLLQIRNKTIIRRRPRDMTVQRTRSWIRESGRRSLVTSLRRSVSQLFGRASVNDDDVTLLSNSPHHRTSSGCPLSEAPPSYSEAMELHRILGFYDVDNRFNRADYDAIRSEHNTDQETTNQASCNLRDTQLQRYYRRKRPTQLRIRSQYNDNHSNAVATALSRDVTTGPAEISIARRSDIIREFSVSEENRSTRSHSRQSLLITPTSNRAASNSTILSTSTNYGAI